MMTKKGLLFATLLLLSTCLLSAQEGGIKVYPSRHGVEAGAQHKTLLAIELERPLKRSDQLQLRFAIPTESQRLIESLEVLSSDSLAVRDLDDYKGRVKYATHPLNLSLIHI